MSKKSKGKNYPSPEDALGGLSLFLDWAEKGKASKPTIIKGVREFVEVIKKGLDN